MTCVGLYLSKIFCVSSALLQQRSKRVGGWWYKGGDVPQVAVLGRQEHPGLVLLLLELALVILNDVLDRLADKAGASGDEDNSGLLLKASEVNIR